MSNIFIYPYGDIKKSNSKNPYIQDFINSMTDYMVLNKDRPNKYGIFDAFLFFNKADTFIFNWTENIPQRKLGTLQTLAYICLAVSIRVFKKRLIWILHNKESHNNKSTLSEICMFISGFMATRIITHSKNGLQFVCDKFGNSVLKKTQYIPHPTKGELIDISSKQVLYDFILWGTITKYKGIYEFLNYIGDKKEWANKKILICGVCTDSNYLQKILFYQSQNVIIKEGYLEDDDLNILISNSGFILFTYLGDSVLSSGALIKSLVYGKPIIGPDFSAFKDLKDEGLISTYKNYNEILKLSDEASFESIAITRYLEQNNWTNLIDTFLQ